MQIHFETAIDFYSAKSYPTRLEFRPQLGDRVPFAGQIKHFYRYPVLEIKKIEYVLHNDGDVGRLDCILGFPTNADEETCKRIINHEDLYADRSR